ncbi:BMC_2a_G0040180.mRNA.1.CDS.1 [Saccharomyces cerevisiae]|nr:BMC_2a_G0040180.mRNA.1.CDS.1 [Saccharomyces cerevisiae]CAI4570669.1 BMB_G0040170.mRNA.1.CDS.1 [Saccharomyces cerevisiae]CAI7188017.1 BMC_2a_G0040180.mRNA.1.CDS.1 [Saccharomyces cerevisiae]CAI7190605.1 BMB_G0040170.mRNA.1.CDS.1 [Saccharomyces cerevisiae]
MIQIPILLSSFLFLYIRALLHRIHPYICTQNITSYNFLGEPFKSRAARCDKNLKARLSLDYVLFQVMVPFPPFSLEPERR